jgi:hypothetical protein
VKRILLVLFLALVLAFPIAFAQVVPDTVGTTVAVEATSTSGPTLLEQIFAVFKALVPFLSWLVTTGAVFKYAPFMTWLPNKLIGWANGLVAFLTLFVVQAPAAHAGIFGDIVHSMGFELKVAGSGFLAISARLVYETFGRALFELIEKKTGLHPAGLTKAEVTARRATL